MPMQAQRIGGNTSPNHSQSNTRRRMVITTLRPPYSQEIPSADCIVGLGVGLDFMADLTSSGIRSTDRPDRRKSLYRLSYPGRILHDHTTVKFHILFVSRFLLLLRCRVLSASDSNETFLSSLQFYNFTDPGISQRC